MAMATAILNNGEKVGDIITLTVGHKSFPEGSRQVQAKVKRVYKHIVSDDEQCIYQATEVMLMDVEY